VDSPVSVKFPTAKDHESLRDNSLTIVLVTLSLFTIGGMLLTGWPVYDHELTDHAANLMGLAAYSQSGHFLSSLFENWESEFLQMSAYVMLTAFLFQRGASESKDPDEPADQYENPALKLDDPEAPWPVRVGGFAQAVYSYSLGIALGFLFELTFILHLRRYSAEAKMAKPAAWPANGLHGGEPR
jgi:hypothetical protein